MCNPLKRKVYKHMSDGMHQSSMNIFGRSLYCNPTTYPKVRNFPNKTSSTFGQTFVYKKNFTLALEGVPIFGLHNRTATYRFVTLVDFCKNLLEK
ncbi:hypothetical protein IC575_025684 [Cucumis melo]